MKPVTARVAALRCLVKVQQGESLASFFDTELAHLERSESALLHELVFGTLRHWHALCRVSDKLARSTPSPLALAAVHMGLYQLWWLRTPEHAAVSETVEALKRSGGAKAAGFVNALLRAAQAKPKLARMAKDNHALPNWLSKQLKADWPEQYKSLGVALRSSAPVFVRVVSDAKTWRDQHLPAAELIGSHALKLPAGVSVGSLEGLKEAKLSVQDRHAQIAALLFEGVEGKTALDVCAAPGGKSAHLADLGVARLCALDVSAARCARLKDRLKVYEQSLELSVICADALEFHAKPFDLVLLDAPCSATGVIRRHPDINLLRRDTDIKALGELQQALLDHAWKLTKSGGQLLYATCSMLKAENSDQIKAFLKRSPEAKLVPAHTLIQRAGSLVSGHVLDTQAGLQLLPEAGSGDGFFYALLEKP